MKQKREFSKTLLIQESALIWISTLAYIALAFYCIFNGYMGSLPWLTASASLPWAAYGVSQVYYYKKELNNTPTVDNTETTSMSYYTEDDYSDNSDPINTDYGI